MSRISVEACIVISQLDPIRTQSNFLDNTEFNQKAFSTGKNKYSFNWGERVLKPLVKLELARYSAFTKRKGRFTN